MLCPVCHGRRVLEIAGKIQPCGECGGQGTIHCCEGLIALPDPESAPCEPTRAEGRASHPLEPSKVECETSFGTGG